MPVPATTIELPENYAEFLKTVKKRVRTEYLKAVLSADAVQIFVYWDIGNEILQKQSKAGWDSKVINRQAFSRSERSLS